MCRVCLSMPRSGGKRYGAGSYIVSKCLTTIRILERLADNSGSINGFSESLCELELNFEKNPQERLPMGSTSIWRLLDQSTRFPLLKKLTLNCVVLRGNRADENMDEFLQVHRGTLKEIHLQDWYFDSNPPQRDSWFTVLRSFAEKADLERFSPGRYIGFIRYQNQAPGHYSRDSLSRSLNFPEIETGIMRPIPRHMLYRYLICGDPDSPETSLASKLWWQGTDWSEFNFDKLKQVEDEARGLAEASTRQDRS